MLHHICIIGYIIVKLLVVLASKLLNRPRTPRTIDTKRLSGKNIIGVLGGSRNY